MKFSIKREALLEGLNVVGNTLPSKTPSPALNGILMEATGSKLIMVSSTGETSSRTSVDTTQIAEEGQALIPGKMLTNIVKSLSAESLVIKTDEKEITISADKGRYSLRQMDISTFPTITFDNTTDNAITFKISMDKLNEVVKATASSTAQSEKKPILTGINLAYKEGCLIATATDTFRLSQKKIKAEGIECSNDFNITIPMSSVSAIMSSAKSGEELTFTMFQTKLYMSCSNMDFVSVLLDGNYPDTARLTALEFPNSFEFNKIDLLNAIDRAIVLAPNDSAKNREITYNVVSMKSVDEKNAVLKVVNGMVGEANEIVEYNIVKGEGIEFSVNGKYLSDAIKNLNGDKVKINLIDGQKPFTISSDSDLTNYQLLLPVRM